MLDDDNFGFKVPMQDYVCSISPTEFEKHCREVLLGYAEDEHLQNFTITHDVKLKASDGTYQIDLYATFTALRHSTPSLITEKAEEAIALFEALGFERKHKKTGINDADITSVRMKDENGFHVDVTKVEKMPRDLTAIRMNVDNFDEAYEFLKTRGFINAQGDKVTDTGSSRSTLMVSPSGFAISLTQHIKNHD